MRFRHGDVLESRGETERPEPLLAKALDFAGGSEQARKVDHECRLFSKIACCSTRPDQSGRSRHPSTAPNDWMIWRARSSVIAASSWALKTSTASQRAWYSA